jgi:hypothetical protein
MAEVSKFSSIQVEWCIYYLDNGRYFEQKAEVEESWIQLERAFVRKEMEEDGETFGSARISAQGCICRQPFTSWKQHRQTWVMPDVHEEGCQNNGRRKDRFKCWVG